MKVGDLVRFKPGEKATNSRLMWSHLHKSPGMILSEYVVYGGQLTYKVLWANRKITTEYERFLEPYRKRRV